MKKYYLIIILSVFLIGCVTTTHIHYSDPNYLQSNEFSSFNEIKSLVDEDDTIDTSNYIDTLHYDVDNFYDYSFSLSK